MSSAKKTVRVILNTPARSGAFDYAVPENMSGEIVPGMLVIVPFNRGIHQAVVWQTDADAPDKKLLPVMEIPDPEPVLSAAQMQLAEKISERSLAPLHECVNLLLTDKIRRVSRPLYCLSESGAPFQTALPVSSPDDGSRDAVLSLFAEKRELTEKDLDQALGKNKWKTRMQSLIRAGLVRRSYAVNMSGPGPKMRIAAALCPDKPADEAGPFSKSPAADARRRAVLRYLKEHGGEVLQTELMNETGADRPDLAYLEKHGMITMQTREVWRDHQYYMQEQSELPPELNAEQQAAFDRIAEGLSSGSTPQPILLHGVTGSGKTEVYLRSAGEAIRQGKQVLMLVPEIALTPQILARFECRFPGITGVYHSRLSDGERYDTWRRGRSGEFRVIVGPRSALAVPLPDLGLILVDECHEDAYYQMNERPFFSAVRAAADLAEITGSQLVLGSATPTTSQMFKAQHSWKIAVMKNRATGVMPPKVLLADMRAELKSGNSEIFSRALVREIGRTLEMGKQCILFLNRRGTASYTFCHSCGKTFECPNCEIPYTWHANRGRLECHYCGSVMKLPEVCPDCGSTEIRQFGAGVELVEELIAGKFPSARVIRMDADTAEGAGKHEKLLSQFARHEADILVGTQMVAKGLDFPNVRLVGILLADVGANFHDYRVDEHTFQMLTQVAGRAGRSDEQGIAILQTYQPERYSIREAVTGDYSRFYKNDLAYRRLMGYPPFSRMLRLEIRDADPDAARQKAFDLAEYLKAGILRDRLKLRLIGPAPCFFPKLNGKYRWHIILRGPDPVRLIRSLDISAVRVEVDPPSLL